jgi:acyl carrier protein
MTDAAAVETRIARILSASLHLDIPSVETDLFETGAIDSLAFVEFLLRLEREFGITVTVEDLEIDHFRTIRRIAQFVSGRDGKTPVDARWEGGARLDRAG